MKKVGVILCFTIICSAAFSQHNLKDSTCSIGEIVYNQFDEFACQYNRIVSIDTENPNRMIITLVFINGNSTTAIQYRQEAMTGVVEWIDAENGRAKREKFVETITATIKPGHIISWKYSYTPNAKSKSKTANVDKAALLILDDNMKTRKVIFPAEIFKIQ